MKWINDSKKNIQNEVTIDNIQVLNKRGINYKQVSYIDDQRDGRFSTAVPYDMEVAKPGEKMMLSDLIQGYVELQEIIVSKAEQKINEETELEP